MTPAAAHAVDTQALIVGVFTALTLVWGAVLVLTVRNRRRPTPPRSATPRAVAAPPREIPVYRITDLPERPASRALDDTVVQFVVRPEDPTQVIPRQRHGGPRW